MLPRGQVCGGAACTPGAPSWLGAFGSSGGRTSGGSAHGTPKCTEWRHELVLLPRVRGAAGGGHRENAAPRGAGPETETAQSGSGHRPQARMRRRQQRPGLCMQALRTTASHWATTGKATPEITKPHSVLWRGRRSQKSASLRCPGRRAPGGPSLQQPPRVGSPRTRLPGGLLAAVSRAREEMGLCAAQMLVVPGTLTATTGLCAPRHQ